jgi:rhodanese-related sulfurtransferase
VSDQNVTDQKLDAAAEIFGRANHRAHELGLNYAGAVTPTEAHQLAEAGAARIVDVRTPEEWRDVGHVDGPALIVWPRSGGEEEVQAFLKKLRERFEPSQPLLFLCRSGARSHYAAHVAAAAGFRKAYNILEGFEGHPGANDGWRAAGLPWKKG